MGVKIIRNLKSQKKHAQIKYMSLNIGYLTYLEITNFLIVVKPSKFVALIE